MADEKTDFLSRWSKRKIESRNAPSADEDAATGEAAAGTAAPEPAEPEDPEDHPAAGIDIETLDRDSDYTVFMHKKVPVELRNRALRKLWLSDPVFANLDGLNDYDEDYTDAKLVVKGLKEAFDQSRKLMLEEEERARAAAEAESAQPEATDEAEETPGEDAPGPDAEDGDGDDGDRLA